MKQRGTITTRKRKDGLQCAKGQQVEAVKVMDSVMIGGQ